MRLLLIPALAFSIVSAASAGGEPTLLLREWTALNSACRGGSGDDPATLDACARRDAVDRQLTAAGWCYGRPGEAGYQKVWQRCPNGTRR